MLKKNAPAWMSNSDLEAQRYNVAIPEDWFIDGLVDQKLVEKTERHVVR